VVTGATVTRILFDDANVGAGLTASGIEYVRNKSARHVKAKKEVILSAGCACLFLQPVQLFIISTLPSSIQNPKILELSG
jgi:hypothetical protein